MGRRVAVAALSALLAFGGLPVAPALAEDEPVVADEKAIELVGGASEAGAIAAQDADATAQDATAQGTAALDPQTIAVSYVWYSYDDGVLTKNEDTAYDCTEVLSEDSSQITDSKRVLGADGTDGTEAWYVVTDQDVTIKDASILQVKGTVNLILCDGASLSVGSIEVTSGNTLNIYGQAAGTGKLKANDSASQDSGGMDQIEVQGSASASLPGIGGTEQADAGTIAIHGGVITAAGDASAAGIGGASGYASGTTNIYGGTVLATGGENAAGIGGGAGGSAGTTNIYGGRVTAKAGSTTAQGIGYGAPVSGNTSSAGTLFLGKGIVLKGGANKDAATKIATGAASNYTGKRYQYMATVSTYTIAFNANGHGTAPATQTVESGSEATEPDDLVASGYTFGGWFTDKSCTEEYDFATPVNASLTLYAKWTPVSKEAVVLKYGTAAVTKVCGDKPFINALTNKSGVKVTYKSSNTKVATVSSIGKVTVTGVGTATITASYAGDATHKAASAKYTLTVGLAKVAAKGFSAVCNIPKKTITATWAKVPGSAYYQVQWQVLGGKWKTVKTKKLKSVRTKAKIGKCYMVRVRAVSGKTTGAWSVVRRRWFKRATKVRATSTAAGKVKVRWAKVANANRGYVVQVRYSKNGKVVTKKTVKANKTSATFKIKSGKKVWVSVYPQRKVKGKTYIGALVKASPVKVK